MSNTTIEDCPIVLLPKISDHRGNLSFIEANQHLPFEFKRVFYLYDIPTGESRGAHAHKELNQFLICLSGGFDVVLSDGKRKKTIHLNTPGEGLHIRPMIWASETNFYPGTVCLVLTSDYYQESDYVRSYADFLTLRGL